ncbi:hypothetical protein BBJ28_00014535 [Nothophytophthora sp. Chile5]|nr:hypothetical protein BBJ28_00014535 [Nothophytophthora sp. Chile5]
MTRVVIVGGGPAGINCAQALAQQLTAADDTEVLLLEKSAFYYHAVGAPRAYVDADFVRKLFVPYDDAIPKAAAGFVRVLRAVATRISANESEVSYRTIDAADKESETTETLRFDYLILAMGSTYTTPIKQDSRDPTRSTTEAQMQDVHGQIEKANKILVVGGGAVGCEVAGEIKAKYPTKSVTILEARDKLIATNNLCDKFYSYLDHALGKLKIEVILGERLEVRLEGNCFEKRTLRTDKGTVIESDIQLLCGGFHPATALVQDMDASLLTDRGAIKVNDQLQLAGKKHAHVFALGDATDHATPKLAYWAGEQGKFLARELVAVIRKKQEGFTTPFPKVTAEALILPLGPSGGVSQLPVWGGLVFGDWITWLIKARDMFAGKTWSSFGAAIPN